MGDVSVLLSSLRSELQTMKGRRTDLRAQLDALEREHDKLETTVSVLEARVGVDSASDPADPLEDVPLADRIVDALGTSGLRRQDLLRTFMPQGCTESAIDSATNRLRKRGVITKRGRRFVRAGPLSASTDVAVSGGAPPEPAVPGLSGVGGLESGVEPVSNLDAVVPASDDRGGTRGSPDSKSAGSSGGSVADADRRPLTEQVREAIAGGISTRKDLDEYFARRGVTARRVKRAVFSLRERKVKALAPLPSGRLALADTDG